MKFLLLLYRIRPKKVVLFPEIGRVKYFLLPTVRISQMCMRIYIFCFKKTNTNKKISTSKFIRTNLHFSLSINRAVKFIKHFFWGRLDFVWPYMPFIIYNQKARPLSMVTRFVFFHSFITLVMMLCFYHSEESHFYIVAYILSYLHGSIS